MTLSRTDLAGVAEELDAIVDEDDVGRYRPRYNIAPTQPHWIALEDDGERRLVPAVWGLRAPDGKLVINARGETVGERRMFRDALERRRCVVPADGFYEWTGARKDRRPIWLHRPDRGLLYFAGLFEDDPAGGPDGARRFVVLTTAPNKLCATLHNRMPAILTRAQVGKWMRQPMVKLLVPAPDGALAATAGSSRVNSVENDDPACLEPPSRRDEQLSFF